MLRWSRAALGLSFVLLAGLSGCSFPFVPAKTGSHLGAPINSFVALNLGQGTNALPSTAHLKITNRPSGALGSSHADVIFLPSSLVTHLSATEISQIRTRLSAGAFAISWADGKTPVSQTTLENVLGYPIPGSSTSASEFAVGLWVLPNGQSETNTFSGYGVTSPSTPSSRYRRINLLGIQSIWAGLNSIRNNRILMGRAVRRQHLGRGPGPKPR